LIQTAPLEHMRSVDNYNILYHIEKDLCTSCQSQTQS